MARLLPQLLRSDDRGVGARDGFQPPAVDGGPSRDGRTRDARKALEARNANSVRKAARTKARRKKTTKEQPSDAKKTASPKRSGRKTSVVTWSRGRRSGHRRTFLRWTCGSARRGTDAFQPGQEVTCDYVYDEDLPGTSRKFNCAITKDDVVKVRYGEENGKVEGEVIATRLLWALGFGADGVYPVKVQCRGCSADPWANRKPVSGEQYFEIGRDRTQISRRRDQDGQGRRLVLEGTPPRRRTTGRRSARAD